MATLDVKKLSIVERQLYTPRLEEIVEVLRQALGANFSEVDVSVVECPDLTQEPFTLAGKGLNGNPKILEIGGPAFLLPNVQREKVYDIQPLLKTISKSENALIIGAGAGPWPYLNKNCELMMNLSISSSIVKNQTRLASVNTVNDCCILQTVDNKETRFALLANLFVSEGIPGKVLKVHVKKRIGDKDFVASIRTALADHYKDKLIGLGGTFIIKEGKAKQHVMQDFSKTPLNNEEELNNWLRFFNMSAPLIAVGTLVTAETDLDLRVQHFHSFSHHGEGGHYHIDTTPETVEYLGYFNTGNTLYRIDKPIISHTFGKD
ncbi:ester hydrolase C11orf54 homolog [Orussus abietinus]|uniref:ester hydrolase C11orf54 homolog n=1 Tax=Orussus abietinus TaxID=222816 RepID=UPI000625B5BC|nr:ester hydrolase C11orf54 homolog [Orussus abietinus]